MKITCYDVNPNKLHRELIDNGLIPVSVLFDDFQNGSTANTTWITFEDNANEELINNIIARHDPTPLPSPPTELELLRQENTLLKAQVQATSERADFHEELIAELAMMIIP